MLFRNAAILLGLLTVGSASAVQFKDYDQLNALLNSGGNAYVSGTFNIAGGDGRVGDVWGYSAATHTITSATATFGITANGASTKEFAIDLGAFTGAEFNPTSFSASFTFGSLDNVFGSATLLADLSADGILGYKILQERGTFTVTFAQLLVNANVKTPPPLPPAPKVPEAASTIALLGIATGALVTVRRRFAS